MRRVLEQVHCGGSQRRKKKTAPLLTGQSVILFMCPLHSEASCFANRLFITGFAHACSVLFFDGVDVRKVKAAHLVYFEKLNRYALSFFKNIGNFFYAAS